MGNALALFGEEVGDPVQISIDELDRYFTPPFGVAVSPDNSTAYVSTTGSGTSCTPSSDVATPGTVTIDLSGCSLGSGSQDVVKIQFTVAGSDGETTPLDVATASITPSAPC